ncbi:MAG: sugar phosphate nucleotidyltransferase [Actinomycetota bacterium]|nr:NDP-sugar synthase [Actinomycetota bacterium]
MDVIGIGLAGGRGERARPLSVKAPGYLRSKAAMTFLGKRLVRWIVEILRDQGMEDYFIVAHGKENRYQIKMLIDHGEPLGVRVRYSRVRFDGQNSGSADATLQSANYWDLRGTALVFPTDSIVDMDLAAMADAHARTGAVVTIGAMVRPPMIVAGKYGVMLTEPDGRIDEFVEKPSLAEIHEAFPAPSEGDFDRMPLLTNSGFYMVDLDALREIGEHDDVREMSEKRLDFGLDLLPWLVAKGYPVYAHPIGRIGDLGSIPDYVETMVDALWGRFPSVSRLMGRPLDDQLWIEPESLGMRDHDSGLTLAEKMQRGLVTIGPAVRIGKYSEIFPGANISESNIDDGCEIHPNAHVVRSQIRDGAMIGSAARVENSYIGSMAEVRSTHAQPTTVEEFVALGDEVVLQPGVSLADGISMYPRVRVPAGAAIPPGSEIRSAEDVMRYL